MADQNQNRKQYTKQGYQELLDELRRRQQEEREKIREDIAVAKSFGDLSENSEYDAARAGRKRGARPGAGGVDRERYRC